MTSGEQTIQPYPSFMARRRIFVYERCGYRCMHCRWRPEVPDGYNGRHALGEDVVRTRGSKQYPGVRLLELDHTHPRAKGGPNTRDNLQALCNSCNARKGDRI